jgi:hypothetical protein
LDPGYEVLIARWRSFLSGSKESKEQSIEQDLKECSGCGRKIPKMTRFCRECGAAQTRDAFFILAGACILVFAAVVTAVWVAGPYSLAVNIAAPILTLVVFAVILSLLLWR